MAWSNEEEITTYIERLKAISYLDKGVQKNGVDNYKTILEYTETIIEKRKKEKQLLLININSQLTKVQYYITKLEESLATNGMYDQISIFQQNLQSLGDTSSDMMSISSNIITTITVDLSRLKQYKRTQKELLAKSINVRSLLQFYEESNATLNDLKGKLV